MSLCLDHRLLSFPPPTSSWAKEMLFTRTLHQGPKGWGRGFGCLEHRRPKHFAIGLEPHCIAALSNSLQSMEIILGLLDSRSLMFLGLEPWGAKPFGNLLQLFYINIWTDEAPLSHRKNYILLNMTIFLRRKYYSVTCTIILKHTYILYILQIVIVCS